MIGKRTIDLTGHKYGRLTVISFYSINKNRASEWLCQCECSNELIVSGNSLRKSNTRSCGCLNKEQASQAALKHGHAKSRKSRTYSSWRAMRNRCYKPTFISYPYCGARGIKVCDRWKNSFQNFLDDMGERPPARTLDRKDNDGHYELSNCRWATRSEQDANRRPWADTHPARRTTPS